jgi:predicted component of type VI protein secretion system
MQAKLHLVKGKPQDKQVEVPPGVLKVGRDPDSDLIIAVASVSRHHCEIVNQQDKLIIRDSGSRGGTLVNGEKVTEQTLKPGDKIQIGPLTFAVEIDGVRTSPAKPAHAKPAVAPGKVPPSAKAGPALKPGAAKPKAPMPSGKRVAPDDVLSALDRLAAGPKKKPGAPGVPPQKKPDDVLEISDDDLLDEGN